MRSAVLHELRNLPAAGLAVGREQDAALPVDGAETDIGASWVETKNRAFRRPHFHIIAELDSEWPAAPDDGLPLLQPALDAPVMMARHQGMAVIRQYWNIWHLPRLLSKKLFVRIYWLRATASENG